MDWNMQWLNGKTANKRFCSSEITSRLLQSVFPNNTCNSYITPSELAISDTQM